MSSQVSHTQFLARRAPATALLGCGMILAMVGGTVPQSASLQARSDSQSSRQIVLTEEDYYTSGAANTFWPNLEAKYHKLHPNVTFNRTTVPQAEYVPHLLEQASSGSLPDIVMIDNPYVAQFASTGMLTPLTSIGKINVSNVAPTELYDGKYKGTLYAVPPYTNSIALAYNRTIFAGAHLTPPTTWAQLESDAKRLTTSKVFGFEASQGLNNAQDNAFWNLAPFLYTNAGANVTSHINSPAAIAALNVFVAMERDGSMPKSEVSWTGTQGVEYFQTGRAAMAEMGAWELSALGTTKGLNWGIVPLPTRTRSQTLLVPTGGETWAIPRSDPPAAKQAAFEYLKWLLTPSVDEQEAIGMGGDVPTVKQAVAPAEGAMDRKSKSVGEGFKAFVDELVHGGTARTEFTGTAFNAVSTTIGNAIDGAFIGKTTAGQAFDSSLASTVSSELKSAGMS